MNIPRPMRKQMDAYAREGFTVASMEFRAGSHCKVVFDQFSQPQFLTEHMGDPRALKNNISRFKRLAREHAEKGQGVTK